MGDLRNLTQHFPRKEVCQKSSYNTMATEHICAEDRGERQKSSHNHRVGSDVLQLGGNINLYKLLVELGEGAGGKFSRSILFDI